MAPAPPSPRPGKRLEAVQVFVEAQVEVDPLHLAVGDPVQPGEELVVHRQPNGIADGLAPVGRTEPIRLGADVGENFSYQPGNDQLPMTVAGIRCSHI